MHDGYTLLRPMATRKSSRLNSSTPEDPPQEALTESALSQESTEDATSHGGIDREETTEVEIYNGEDGGVAADKQSGLRPGYEVLSLRSRSKRQQDKDTAVIVITTTSTGVCTFGGCSFHRCTIRTESKTDAGRVSFLLFIIVTISYFLIAKYRYLYYR